MTTDARRRLIALSAYLVLVALGWHLFSGTFQLVYPLVLAPVVVAVSRLLAWRSGGRLG